MPTYTVRCPGCGLPIVAPAACRCGSVLLRVGPEHLDPGREAVAEAMRLLAGVVETGALDSVERVPGSLATIAKEVLVVDERLRVRR